MKNKRIPELTSADWEEIYYALEYKLTSPAVQGSDDEAVEWREHLKQIMKTVGYDGKNMTR